MVTLIIRSLLLLRLVLHCTHLSFFSVAILALFDILSTDQCFAFTRNICWHVCVPNKLSDQFISFIFSTTIRPALNK